MYSFIKKAAAAAGYAVSEGEELLHTDLQLLRDYMFRHGIPIVNEFHKFEEYVATELKGFIPGVSEELQKQINEGSELVKNAVANAATDIQKNLATGVDSAENTLDKVADVSPAVPVTAAAPAEAPVATAPSEAPAAQAPVETQPAAAPTVTEVATAETSAAAPTTEAAAPAEQPAA